MTYSCVDFTDSILNALNIKVPIESADTPSAQADLALAEIQRLQRIEKEVGYALALHMDEPDATRLVLRLRVILGQATP